MSENITITPLRLLYILCAAFNAIWFAMFVFSFFKDSGISEQSLNLLFTMSTGMAPSGLILYGIYVVAKEINQLQQK